jgi:magnesium-transporting ATPase (P-type)
LIEFSSERKRMTVVVKNLKDHKINVYCKGADCILKIILDIIKSLLRKEDEEISEITY